MISRVLPPVSSRLHPVGAENLRHLGRCSADRGRPGPAFRRR